MSRRPARFDQADGARAILAVERVHGVAATVEMTPGEALRIIRFPQG